MTTEPHADNPDQRDQPPANQSLQARALAKYHDSLEQCPERYVDYNVESVQRTIHELRVHQIELQMQNDELRQSQIALEESRCRFRDLYDNAPVGYCLVSENGLIDDANLTFADLLGYTQSQLNGQTFTSLIDKVDQDVFYHLRRRILVNPKSETCELRMQKSDTSYAWFELSVTMASFGRDNVCLRIAITNIDARVRAEAARALLENQLRESQKMEAVGTLASGIAHDFNNILTVILANAEMTDHLAQSEAPTVVPFVAEIQKAAGRARELVNQILAFCRRQPTNRHVLSLADVIEESVGMLRATIPARFQIQFTCDATVPRVLADETQIEQVVINLATNAIQAMDGKAGRLRIHLDTVKLQSETVKDLNTNGALWDGIDSAVRIVFEDDGPGIEPSVVDRIFEPFYTTKPVKQGTGLGLAVVHGIVRAHDGQIFVKSNPGHGTAFTIYLPPARLATVAVYDAQSSAAHRSETHRTETRDVIQKIDQAHSIAAAHVARSILYLDDDSCVLNAIVSLLEQYGVSVCGYSDPTAALQFLNDRSNHVEVLVTDYNMPGISGLEFAKKVHTIRPALPVVVTSGFIDEELRSHADEAGVMALLQKPLSSRDFLDLLKQVGETKPRPQSSPLK